MAGRLARLLAVPIAFAVVFAAASPGLGQDPGASLATSRPSGSGEAPAIPSAPNGGTIMYDRADADGASRTAYTIAPDGSGRRELLAPKTFDCCPLLSPDGARVVASIPEGDRVSAITVNTDGTGYAVMPLPDKTISLAPGPWRSADDVTFTAWGDSDPSRNGIYLGDPGTPTALRQITTNQRGSDVALDVTSDGSRIAFVRSAGDDAFGPLFTVGADGTNEQQVSPKVASVGPDPGWGSAATWSPDGSQLVFTATVDGCRCFVYVVDADGTNLRQIFRSAGLIIGANWSPDGQWIAFESQPDAATRDQVMIIHPDGTGLRSITTSDGGSGAWDPQWSPDSSTLLFQRGAGRADEMDLWTARIDGSDITQLTHAPGFYDTYSWDMWPVRGAKRSGTVAYNGVLGDIVFARNVTGTDELALFTIDASGTHEQQIQFGAWDGVGLSPDGKTFLSPTIAPDGRLRPLLVKADGSGEALLPVADPTLQLGVTEWSPDGTRLVADAWDDTDASRKGIYTLSVNGGDLVRLTSAGARHDWPAYAGAYSPDGQRILFFRPVAEVDADGVSMNLFVVTADGTRTAQLNPPGIETILFGPSGASDWSPDGAQVAFVGSDGDFWQTDRRAVFTVGADGSDPKRITDWGDVLSVQWSPDGSRLAFTMKGPSDYQIFTVRPDGTDLTPVTSSKDGTLSFGPMWSPDGSRLLFLRGTDLRSRMDLWVMDADGSNPVHVTHSPGAYGGYEWVP